MPKPLIRVFLDTSALKAAKDSQLVFIPRHQRLVWGGTSVEVLVHDMAYKNQNTSYLRNNPEAFKNRLFNRVVAWLAKNKRIELLISNEVRFEAMRVPRVDFSFFGSPIRTVRSPVEHGGLIIDGRRKDYLFNALSQIQDQRFFELQKLSGAYQGKGRELNKNQLFDAYHLWSAEVAGAEFLLTHDERFVRQWASSKYKGITRPIDARLLLEQVIRRDPWSCVPMMVEAFKFRRSGRNLSEQYQNYAEVKEGF